MLFDAYRLRVNQARMIKVNYMLMCSYLFSSESVVKERLKYEMRSYQEMVVKQIRQMSEDNQQLLYFKNKVVKEKKHSKAVEESLGIAIEKLRKTEEEKHIVRRRAKIQHEEFKEEVILTSDTLLEAYLVYSFLLYLLLVYNYLWTIELGLGFASTWLFCWKVFAVIYTFSHHCPCS
jgi:hypothetical protein